MSRRKLTKRKKTAPVEIDTVPLPEKTTLKTTTRDRVKIDDPELG